MVVDFSNINLKEKPLLMLKNLDGVPIQTLGYAHNIEADLQYNEVSTLSFDLPAMVDGVATPNYDKVIGMRIVDLVGVGQFLLIDPTIEDDGVSEIKHCKAYSLEYEWTKKQFYLEGGEDGTAYKFYGTIYDEATGQNSIDPNCMIGRLLEIMPDWEIGYIDPSLLTVYRTFNDVNENAYNFIKSTMQESYGCIVDFDTYERKLYIVSTENDTPTRQVFLSKGSLLKEIEISEDSDSVVTCLDVSGEDGVSIRNVNPIGSNKIYNLDYFMNMTNFSQELIDKWNTWVAKVEANRQAYFTLSMQYNLKVAEFTAANAELTDLKGELTAAETAQAAMIQAVAQDVHIDDEDLAKAKEAVREAQIKVNRQALAVAGIKEEYEAIGEERREINASLSLESRDNFSADELATLRRYFYEDSLEDSSFALAETATYSNEDLSSAIVVPIRMDITGGTVDSVDGGTATDDDATKKTTLFTVNGGVLTLHLQSAEEAEPGVPKTEIDFNAALVRGNMSFVETVRRQARGMGDGDVIFTAYLERGMITTTKHGESEDNVREDRFTSGTLTLVGRGSHAMVDDVAQLSMNEESHLYFTKNATEYEQYSVEWDLYNYGIQVLKEKSQPAYNFKIEAGNFLAMEAFSSFKNEFHLGERVNMTLDGETLLTPYVTKSHINYEDLTDFSLEFSSTYRPFDSSFRLSQLLEQSVSMGKTLSVKSGSYNSFKSSGASTEVKSFMESAVDYAKQAVLSTGNSAITMDDSGLRLRKWRDREEGTYEDDQIWMNENVIAFTTDNWSSACMAIGKIFDQNMMNYVKTSDAAYDESKTYYTYDAEKNIYVVWHGDAATWSADLYEEGSRGGTAYGIAAPYLVGTILAGSNLTISTETGSFVVDNSGVWVKSMDFHIIHTDDSTRTLEEELAEINGSIDDTAQELIDQIDRLDESVAKMVTTYYQPDEPEDEALRKGDLWYQTAYVKTEDTERDTGKTYYYEGEDGQFYLWDPSGEIPWSTELYELSDTSNLYRYNGTAWEQINDAAAAKAIADAANAQTTADRKIVTYYQAADPCIANNVGEGDLWHKTDAAISRRAIMPGDDLTGKTIRLAAGSYSTYQTFPDSTVITGSGGSKVKFARSGAYAEINIKSGYSASTDAYTRTLGYGRTQWPEWNIPVGNFGEVSAVDAGSGYYRNLTAELPDLYTVGKLYRYSVANGWQMVEDGAIGELDAETTRIAMELDDALSDIEELFGSVTTTYYGDVPEQAHDGDLLYYQNEEEKIIWYDGTIISYVTGNVITGAQSNAIAEENGLLKCGSDLLYQNGTWMKGYSYTLSHDFGTVSAVNTESLFYSYIRADFAEDGVTVRRSIRAGDDLSNKTIYFGLDYVLFVSGHLYRFGASDEDNTARWREIRDADAVRAIADAERAADIADGKTMVYRQSSVPDITEHSKGDLWYNTASSEIEDNRIAVDGMAVPGRLYVCYPDASDNGTLKWFLVEDAKLADVVDKHTALFNRLVEANDLFDATLNAETLRGVINANAAQMEAANGNVLFDAQGMWLMDTASKDTAKNVVQMNENGIQIGHRNDTTEEWDFKTAISFAGVIAERIVGNTISGITMNGGALNIGPFSHGGRNDYRFTVDSNGNLRIKNSIGNVIFSVIDGSIGAENGDFSGTIRANDLFVNGHNVLKEITNIKGGQVTGISQDYLDISEIVGSRFYSLGSGDNGEGNTSDSAYYICDGNRGNIKGFIRYDTNGSGGDEAENRVFFTTTGTPGRDGVAMKLQSSGNMSLQSGNYIYLWSNVKFRDGTIADFSNVDVRGLNLRFT